MNSRIELAAAVTVGIVMSAQTWAADDATFLKEAVQGSIAEVQMGQLAEQNGSAEEVKSFGSQLVADHSKAMDEASALAQSKGMEIPTSPKPDAQKEYEHLQGLSGAEFDAAFATHMVKEHELTIEKFEEQSTSGDADVAAFAKATLPALQEHLERAEAITKSTTD